MAQQAKSDEMEQEARSSSSVITADVSRADNFIVQNDRNSLDPSVIITKPLEPETEKKGRFLIKNVKGSQSSNIQTSNHASNVINATLNPQLSHLNTSPLPVITVQGDVASQQSTGNMPSSNSSPSVAAGASLPFPSMASSSPFKPSVEEGQAVGNDPPAQQHPVVHPAGGERWTNNSSSNISLNGSLPPPSASPALSSSASTAATAVAADGSSLPSSEVSGGGVTKKKSSRFIVKSVPKEEEDGRLPEAISNSTSTDSSSNKKPAAVSAPAPIAASSSVSSAAPNHADAAVYYSQMCARLDQVVAMNAQIIEWLAQDHWRKGLADAGASAPAIDDGHFPPPVALFRSNSMPQQKQTSSSPQTQPQPQAHPPIRGIAITESAALKLETPQSRLPTPSTANSPLAPPSIASLSPATVPVTVSNNNSATSTAALPIADRKEPLPVVLAPASSVSVAAGPSNPHKERDSKASSSAVSSGTGLPSSSSSSSLSSEEKDKDNSMAKLSHYLLEMKKELDAAQKQRREKQLETQRLREKCQQLEDQLVAEQNRNQQFADRQKKLQAQLEERNNALAAQTLKIEQLQLELATLKATVAGPIAGESLSAPRTLGSSSSGAGGPIEAPAKQSLPPQSSQPTLSQLSVSFSATGDRDRERSSSSSQSASPLISSHTQTLRGSSSLDYSNSGGGGL